MLVRRRKETGFFRWLGFYRPALKSKWWVLLVFAVLYAFFYNFDFTQLVSQETLDSVESSSAVSANAFAGIGALAILPALIENFIANGVAEEILYRGFLCKRLCGKLGTVPGIILQAVLFGLMHNLLYIAAGLDVGLWYHVLTFLFTGVGALLLGWLNEKNLQWFDHPQYPAARLRELYFHDARRFWIRRTVFSQRSEPVMKENRYDDPAFFQKYSEMARSKLGLEGAGEWQTLEPMLPDFAGARVLDLGCGYGWHAFYAAENGAVKGPRRGPVGEDAGGSPGEERLPKCPLCPRRDGGRPLPGRQF